MPVRSIEERLQVKAQRRLAVIDAPPELDEEIGATGARAPLDLADVVLSFAYDLSDFKSHLSSVLRASRNDAILWFAYPKLTSSMASDIHRDIIREMSPKYGLETVAQIAIDEDWSALRLKRVEKT